MREVNSIPVLDIDTAKDRAIALKNEDASIGEGFNRQLLL